MGGFVRGLIWFVGLFFAFAIVTAARRMSEDGMTSVLALQFILLQMPRILLFTLPASLLFGTVSAFNELSSKGEITALGAGGMSLSRMLRAPLVLGAILSLTAFWLQEVLVPGAELQKTRIAGAAIKRAKASQVFPITDKRKDGTIARTIQVKDFDLEKRVLYEPYIQIHRADGTTELTIYAEEARWNPQTKEWQFLRGQSFANRSIKEPISKTAPFSIPTTFDSWSFKTNVVPNPDELQSNRRSVQSELKSHNFEMVSRQDLLRYRRDNQNLLLNFPKIKNPPPELAEKAAKAPGEINAATFGLHDKIATPLIVLAFVLIGAPLGVRPQRTASPGLAMGLSLMILLGYYMVWTLCSFWGKGGGVFPSIAAYFPVFLIGGLGALMVWKKN